MQIGGGAAEAARKAAEEAARRAAEAARRAAEAARAKAAQQAQQAKQHQELVSGLKKGVHASSTVTMHYQKVSLNCST